LTPPSGEEVGSSQAAVIVAAWLRSRTATRFDHTEFGSEERRGDANLHM
jgi:hypothetical protein